MLDEGHVRITLNLTSREYQLFDLLFKRESVSSEIIHTVLFGNTCIRDHLSERFGSLMNYVRNKLKVHNVQVKNLSGFGYYISAADKKILKQLLGE